MIDNKRAMTKQEVIDAIEAAGYVAEVQATNSPYWERIFIKGGPDGNGSPDELPLSWGRVSIEEDLFRSVKWYNNTFPMQLKSLGFTEKEPFNAFEFDMGRCGIYDKVTKITGRVDNEQSEMQYKALRKLFNRYDELTFAQRENIRYTCEIYGFTYTQRLLERIKDAYLHWWYNDDDEDEDIPPSGVEYFNTGLLFVFIIAAIAFLML